MPKAKDLLVAALMLAGTAGIVLAQKQIVPEATPGSSEGSLEEVALHSTRESCWTVINGSIYDLTSWIPQHPGGEQAILQLCGIDGSALFNGQHGGAARQEAILAGFRIGGSGATSGSVSAPAQAEDDHGRGRGRGGDDND